MDALFLVDRDACKKEMSAAECLAHRRALAQESVDEIEEASKTLRREALPQSALGKAPGVYAERVTEACEVIRGTRVKQQPGGELYEGRGLGEEELDWLHVGIVKAG